MGLQLSNLPGIVPRRGEGFGRSRDRQTGAHKWQCGTFLIRDRRRGEVDDKAVCDQLRQCYDPEIPVNIVDLVPVQDENPAAIGGRLKSVFLDGDRAIGTEMMARNSS